MLADVTRENAALVISAPVPPCSSSDDRGFLTTAGATVDEGLGEEPDDVPGKGLRDVPGDELGEGFDAVVCPPWSGGASTFLVSVGKDACRHAKPSNTCEHWPQRTNPSCRRN